MYDRDLGRYAMSIPHVESRYVCTDSGARGVGRACMGWDWLVDQSLLSYVPRDAWCTWAWFITLNGQDSLRAGAREKRGWEEEKTVEQLGRMHRCPVNLSSRHSISWRC